MRIKTIGELAKTDKQLLIKKFGKHGMMMWEYANGIDNSEVAYEGIEREERERYQSAFIFYSKIRRAVKIRYCDSIDNKEYEPIMQSLLDNHHIH